jgi:ribosomal protein L25 (general stress protein Ctc)
LSLFFEFALLEFAVFKFVLNLLFLLLLFAVFFNLSGDLSPGDLVMKQRIDLTVEPRATGKSVSRALRNDRKIPGVIYGALDNANVSIYEGDIVRYNVRNYENALFNLKSTDKKTDGKVVLIKEVIVHPVTRRPQHVDFFALDLTKAVAFSLKLNLRENPLASLRADF